MDAIEGLHACAGRAGFPVPASASPASRLVDSWQVMDLNPAAGIQRQMLADGYVPNSGEFELTVPPARFVVQRGESLSTGRVQIYGWNNATGRIHCTTGRGDPRGAGRACSGSYDGFASGTTSVVERAQQEQRIRFNPGAGLQRAMFDDGFVPNSPEVSDVNPGLEGQVPGVIVLQRGERLSDGAVRVYGWTPRGVVCAEGTPTPVWQVSFAFRHGTDPSGIPFTDAQLRTPSGTVGLGRFTGHCHLMRRDAPSVVLEAECVFADAGDILRVHQVGQQLQVFAHDEDPSGIHPSAPRLVATVAVPGNGVARPDYDPALYR